MSFSDLKVNMVGEKVNAHKFVLAARSDVWSLASMASTSELDLTGEQPWCDCFKVDSNEFPLVVLCLCIMQPTKMKQKKK